MKYSIFHIEGGIGKNIVATNVVRSIKNAYQDRELVVVTPYPEVFIHNPYIYRVYKTGLCPYFYEDFIKDKDTIVFKHEPYNSNGVITRQQNLAEAWCGSLNLKSDRVQPELYFNQIEQENAGLLFQKYSNGKPMIALQTNGGLGTANNNINFNWFRDLPPVYAQQLVNEFSHNFNFVQIRHSGQTVLENVTQIDVPIREMFLLLSQVKGAVCIDSVVQHVMAAYNKPSLVCWIGNSPVVYGYALHSNLISNLRTSYQNIESYLDPYPLQPQGHQCPTEYDVTKLFNYNDIQSEFMRLYLSDSDKSY